MSGQNVQSYIGRLPTRLKRELAEELRRQADGLADAIRAAAPQGETGKLRASVEVRRGRGTLSLVVTAGGDDTTKEVRQGSGQPYDYAMGVEFGNEHAPAQPFFYSTYAERKDDIDQAIQDKVADVLDRA
jgi:HK97 gp10 family phage protein